MNLFLMRHGEALSEREDLTRPLSETGREESEKIAFYLKKENIRFDKIYYSTLRRAAETARIVAVTLGLEHCLSERRGLSPNDSIESIADEIEQRVIESPEKNLLIVGHLPFLADLALHLAPQTGRAIAFPTGTVVYLQSGTVKTWKITAVRRP